MDDELLEAVAAALRARGIRLVPRLTGASLAADVEVDGSFVGTRRLVVAGARAAFPDADEWEPDTFYVAHRIGARTRRPLDVRGAGSPTGTATPTSERLECWATSGVEPVSASAERATELQHPGPRT